MILILWDQCSSWFDEILKKRTDPIIYTVFIFRKTNFFSSYWILRLHERIGLTTTF